MRKQIFAATRPDPGFRWRGTDIGRLEGLSDTVFGFAITLLVVSLDVPQTFDELLRDMRGFIAFGVCFAYLVHLWFQHYIYFRRYALESIFVVICNTFLLFVVLLYVYPLKFLSGYLIDGLVGLRADESGADSVAPPVIADDQVHILMIVFGLGFVAVTLAYLLLYVYAYHQRDMLALNPLECFDTRSSIQSQAIKMGLSLISVAVAYFGGPDSALVAGLIYLLIMTPMLVIHGIHSGRRRTRLQRAFAA